MTNPLPVDLVGVGLNATDTVIPLETYPARGSKTEYSTVTTLPGGQVATTVVACQQWGLRTRYVGKLGDDLAATLHREAFSHAGVEAHIITAPSAPSAQSLILVDAHGERTVLCRRDERIILHPSDLHREWITNARALHVDGHDTEAAIEAAAWAREANIPVIADLDELYPNIESLLTNVDYLIVSRDFPSRLTAEPNLDQALRKMYHRYNAKLAAATLGEEGVLAFDGTQLLHIPAFRVPVIDTTGAGDIFHAGFIYALLQNWPLNRQLEFACAAAALNCTAVGARGGIHSLEDIATLIATGTHHPTAQSSASAR
jgi:sulfofructose kinase